MGNVILFCIAFLISLLGMMMYKVTDKSISVFESAVLCFITELCIGAVIVGIYSILGILISLFSIGLAYLTIGIIVWFVILKKKKVQRLEMRKGEIYAIFIILGCVICIFVNTFTVNVSNVYRNSDPGTHMLMALQVIDTGEVSSMYFAEVYNAMVISIFQPFLVRINYYKAFILADTLANVVNVLMFYILALRFCKSRFSKIVLPIVCIFYFLGWPFFSYIIGGFVHLGWGVTLFMYVMYWLMVLYECGDRKKQISILALILLGSFSILVCYMLYVPIIGLVLIACLICIDNKIHLCIDKRRIVYIVLSIAFFTLICGTICFLGYFGGSWTSVFSALSKGGGIQKELYRDFVFLLPAAIYMTVYYIKNKEPNLLVTMLISVLFYTIIAFVICRKGLMSAYYYYKGYYLIWMILWLVNIMAIEYLYNKDRLVVFAYGFSMLFAIVMTMSGVDSRLAEERIVIDEVSYRHYPSLFPIWDRMEIFISEEDDIADKEALIDICNYSSSVLTNKTDEMVLVTPVYYHTPWYRCYGGGDTIGIDSYEEFEEVITMLENGNEFFLVHQNNDFYRKKKKVLDKYQCIYSNGYYGIYR